MEPPLAGAAGHDELGALVLPQGPQRVFDGRHLFGLAAILALAPRLGLAADSLESTAPVRAAVQEGITVDPGDIALSSGGPLGIGAHGRWHC